MASSRAAVVLAVVTAPHFCTWHFLIGPSVNIAKYSFTIVQGKPMAGGRRGGRDGGRGREGGREVGGERKEEEAFVCASCFYFTCCSFSLSQTSMNVQCQVPATHKPPA